MSANVTLVGRLGGDPELRFTQSGKAVASFSMVTSKSTRNADGSWDESETTWYRVDVWETLAEAVVESLNKGDSVIVVGRVYMDSYKGKDGQERQSLKVVAYNVGPDLKRAKRSQPARSVAAVEADPWATQDDAPPF